MNSVTIEVITREDLDALGKQTTGETTLSRQDRRILALERHWWRYVGSKDHVIREIFDMNSTQYYQLLNDLLDQEEALAYDPMLVKRLRRARASRTQERSARRLGI